MTAAEAIVERSVVYHVASKADVDPRTVFQALKGRKGKGSAYRRTMVEIAAVGIDVSTIPTSPTKPTESAARQLSAVVGGKHE